jgi:hypothetical protein
MRRGLISWSQEEVPAGVLDRRLARLVAAMRDERLSALIAYTSFPRPSAVSWLTHFVPYWGEGLLIVVPDGTPSLLTAYSKRGETWIREVSHVDQVIMTPNLGQVAIDVLKKRVPAMANGAARIGIIERDELPWTIAEPMVEQGLASALVDASALFASVRQPADEAEIRLARRALQMVEAALAAIPADARRASAVLAAIESSARNAGAEEVILRIAPDLSASPLLQRIEGDAALSERYAVQVSLAYKGTWVRVTRSLSSSPLPDSWKRAQQGFAEAAARLDAGKLSAGPQFSLQKANLGEWSVESSMGTRPLSLIAQGGGSGAGQGFKVPALPGGSLAVLSVRLVMEQGPWLASAPIVLGGAGRASRLLESR